MNAAIGKTFTNKFKKYTEHSVAELACSSAVNLLKQISFEKSLIDGLIVSSCSNEQYLGNIISEMLGINPKFATRIENLCNSGTSAIFLGYSLIMSKMCKAVLVVGAEKQKSQGNKLDWDITRGVYDMPVHWAALYAKSHFRNFKTTEENLADIVYKNHKNANSNPNSFFYKKEFSHEDIFNSEIIVHPLKKFDCCYPCEGSSSLLLISKEYSKYFDCPIWIKGISQNNQGASFANIASDLRSIRSTIIASKEAFKQSNLKPKDIDIMELHDAFSILELLAYEDIGFVEKGKGAEFITQNSMHINSRGGLLGCGHPIGVTGIDQVGEITIQLQGKAGRRQKKDCKIGLVHNMAAAGTSSTIIILGKER